MGAHPINLALRFVLEIAVLLSIGIWGWNKSEGWLKFILAMGLPLVMATLWGVFAVPEDPSRSGQTVVATAGWIRLILELGFFTLGTMAIHDLGHCKLSYLFASLVILHYLLSYDRLIWLLGQ